MTRIRLDLRGPRFTVVDERIYMRHELSIVARHVLGWMLGRGEDYEIRVAVMRRVHGMSENQWRRVRDELKGDGWLRQVRGRDEKGRVVWEIIVTDAPLSATPPNGGDGTIPPKPVDGSAIHGKGGDNYHEVDLHEIDLHETPSPKPPRVSGGGGHEEKAPSTAPTQRVDCAIQGLASQKDVDLVLRLARKHSVDPQALADELIGRRRRTDLPPVQILAAWVGRAAQGLRDGEEQFAQAGRDWRSSRAPRPTQPAARSQDRADPAAVAAALEQLPWKKKRSA